MADSATQPDTNNLAPSDVDEHETPDSLVELDKGTGMSGEQAAIQQVEKISSTDDVGDNRRAPIIWTPRFITVFALVLALGMSLNSVLAQDWIDGGNNEFWIFVGHILLVLGGWIAAIAIARSWWVRLASIFGCIWATFTIMNLFTDYFHLFHTFEIESSLNALISCSLLGFSICLSTNRLTPRRWDSWFFRLAIIGGIAIAVIPYVLSFAANPDIGVLESDVAFSAVLLSLLTWWARPSCWKNQPGPTLLFGIAPALFLFLAIPGVVDRAENIFFLETLYLCLFLGILRVIQGELRWQELLQSKA